MEPIRQMTSAEFVVAAGQHYGPVALMVIGALLLLVGVACCAYERGRRSVHSGTKNIPRVEFRYSGEIRGGQVRVGFQPSVPPAGAFKLSEPIAIPPGSKPRN